MGKKGGDSSEEEIGKNLQISLKNYETFSLLISSFLSAVTAFDSLLCRFATL